MMSETEIAIVGAGLSGLSLATRLRSEGHDVTVLEARSRVGGRVLSEQGYDLGPAWIWPHNRRMLKLAATLGLRLFPQYSTGRLVFENTNGEIRRDLDLATMGDALRVEGGLDRITAALGDQLSKSLYLSHPVRRIAEDARGVSILGHDYSLRAERVVLAMPPRLAAGLGARTRDVPTWMAGHSKVVARYPEPFWRTSGLNGDAISHRGPLAEIHDSSPMDAGEGALFGFAIPGAARHPEFRSAAIRQLTRLFGDQAASPLDVLTKDWSTDPQTATERDKIPPEGHPAYHMQPSTSKVILSGSETAAEFGGFLEGALEAAEAAYTMLTRVAA